MLSVETSEVSSVPGREVWNSWNGKLAGDRLPGEDAVDPEILRADVRAQVLPLRIFRIGRRLHRVRADVAEGARHADAIWPHQILVVVVAGIVVIALGVPLLRRRLVEVGIGEQAQADDAGGACRNTNRPEYSCRARRSSRRDICFHSRTDRAGNPGSRLSSHRPKRSGSGPVGFFEARLVDQAEIVPAIVAAGLQAGIGGQRLQEIERADAGLRTSCPRSGRCRRSRRSTCCGP